MSTTKPSTGRFSWGRAAGWLAVSIVYGTLGVCTYFFVIRLGLRWAQTNWLVLWPTLDIAARIAMTVWCHMHCMWSDPGYVFPHSGQVLESDKKAEVCKKCSVVRPPRTHHCSTCNACVERMDHHCPWINNCVGIRTHKAFILFLAYACSAGMECLFLVTVRVFTCTSLSNSILLLGLRIIMGESKVQALVAKYAASAGTAGSVGNEFTLPSEATCDLTIEYALTGFVSVFLAIIFVIFIAFISSDQMHSLLHNQTHVEHLKNEFGPKRTPKEALVETFGSEPSLWWLVPWDARFTKAAAPVEVKPAEIVQGKKVKAQ